MTVALIVLILAFLGVGAWGYRTGYVTPGPSIALAVIGVVILIAISRLLGG